MSHKIIQTEIKAAATILRSSGLVAFPTDTVYGLGADASDVVAIKKIFAAKHRSIDRPLVVLLAEVEQVKEWASEIPDTAQVLIKHFWPGPLTLVLPRAKEVSEVLTAGRNSIGLRIPNHPVALALLKMFGNGIATTSANWSGQQSLLNTAQVKAALGDVIDLVLSGNCLFNVESTIVDLTGSNPEILREGAIRADAIHTVLKANSF